ncbi:MAG: hypothetical protein PHP88_09780 [bacterium]|nr:hypothetical protein [bacterium]
MILPMSAGKERSLPPNVHAAPKGLLALERSFSRTTAPVAASVNVNRTFMSEDPAIAPTQNRAADLPIVGNLGPVLEKMNTVLAELAPLHKARRAADRQAWKGKVASWATAENRAGIPGDAEIYGARVVDATADGFGLECTGPAERADASGRTRYAAAHSSCSTSPCRLTITDLTGTFRELAFSACIASPSNPRQHGTCMIVTVRELIFASSNSPRIFSR